MKKLTIIIASLLLIGCGKKTITYRNTVSEINTNSISKHEEKEYNEKFIELRGVNITYVYNKENMSFDIKDITMRRSNYFEHYLKTDVLSEHKRSHNTHNVYFKNFLIDNYTKL